MRIVLALLLSMALCSAQNLINSYRFAAPAAGPIAVLANVGAGSANGSSITSSSIDTTGAKLLVANVASDMGGSAPTISDSKTNTWTALTEQANGGGGTRNRIYYVANPTVGTGHTFTLSGGSGSRPTICVLALSNVVTASPFDQQNGATINGSTTLATGSVTPGTNDQVVVTGGMCWSSDFASIDNGFTIVDTVFGVGGQHVGGVIAYKVQTTAAAVNPTWTTYGSNWSAVSIATFKHQ